MMLPPSITVPRARISPINISIKVVRLCVMLWTMLIMPPASTSRAIRKPKQEAQAMMNMTDAVRRAVMSRMRSSVAPSSER